MSINRWVDKENAIYIHTDVIYIYIYMHHITYSVQFSHSVMSNSLQPHRLQHNRLSCPSPDSQSLIKFKSTYSVMPSNHLILCYPFSPCLQSFPASRSFPMSQFFVSDGQSIGVSASTSVLPMNTQDSSPLGWTGLIYFPSKGLSRVFSSTAVEKHQFFSAQLSL